MLFLSIPHEPVAVHFGSLPPTARTSFGWTDGRQSFVHGRNPALRPGRLGLHPRKPPAVVPYWSCLSDLVAALLRAPDPPPEWSNRSLRWRSRAKRVRTPVLSMDPRLPQRKSAARSSGLAYGCDSPCSATRTCRVGSPSQRSFLSFRHAFEVPGALTTLAP